jgi:O-antigen/teichoic acid export membrane protein
LPQASKETLSAARPGRHFATEHLKDDLAGHSVRGGAATLINQGGQFAMKLGSTMVLARILVPADFGLLAMVTAVTAFAFTFQDMGLSMATIQRAKLNHRQVSTVFWVNVGLSAAFALLTAGLAPLVAWFYREPRLVRVTIVLASSFVLGGLSIQHRALLKRQMRFGALAAAEITGTAFGVAAAVVSAFLGAGYWSLVVLQVAAAFATTVASWIVCGWRPGLPARRSGVRSMLFFGGHLTGYQLLRRVVQNLDKILIGRFWGAHSLGFYAKAFQLLQLPTRQINTPIMNVAIPALSRVQDEPARYRGLYLRAVKLVAMLTMPPIAAMIVLSREVIELILGPQWVGATRIYMILALAAFIQPVANTNGWVMVSSNQTRRLAIWGLIATPLLALSYVAGLRWGPVGVATAYVLYIYAIRYPSFVYCFKNTPLTVVDLVGAIHRPFLMSVVIGLVMYGCRSVMVGMPVLWIALATGGVGAIALAVVALVWRAARSDFQEIFELVRMLRSRKQAAEAEEAPEAEPGILDEG